MTTLYEPDHLPAGLLDTPAPSLHRILPGPTLIHIPGERPDALFVSVLQHGNEDTGLLAVQRLLADYDGQTLPRPLSLFIGNVEAARHGRRHLDGQVDFNRAWPGTELPAGPETRLLAEVFGRMRTRPLLASIDIHNTSGSSPHHVGVNSLEPRCLQLAHRFSRTVVHFTRPRGAQAQAFLGLCPAVTLECGRVGSAEGVTHARDFLAACLQLDTIPDEPPAPGDLDLFTSVAVVAIPDSVRFGFEWPAHEAEADLDLCLPGDIDRLNFRELSAGTALGRCRGPKAPVQARDPAGHDVTGEFFECSGQRLRLRRAVMPSLLTPDPRIIRQDCLCHLMERIPAARNAA
ncbi:MAG: M14 family metallopeptidase [Halofilum sp. (in: g-proteobacteria)]